MAGQSEIEVENLGKTYPAPFKPLSWLRGRRLPPSPALHQLSFQAAAGEVVGLIGPNGAGKSTLLRILCGLMIPSEGTAKVAQLDVVKDRPKSRQFVGAALSEDRGLSPRLTARQNLLFFAALYGLRKPEAQRRLEELSDRFESMHLLDRPVRTLSGGEKARIILVRVLLHRPRVVLLDELTRSLDPGAAARLRAQIRIHVLGEGAAALFASHDLSEVETLATRVLLLSGGRAAAYGPYAQVKPLARATFDLNGESGT